MSYDLTPFESVLDAALLEALIADHEAHTEPRLERLWRYYRNALAEPTDEGGSAGAPAQRVGLPARLVEIKQLERDDRFSREVVIENDIAWRIHTLVDFMFPAMPVIASVASDAQRRREIESVLSAVISANGGIGLWQNAALLGSVYGHVDFLVSCAGREEPPGGAAHGDTRGMPGELGVEPHRGAAMREAADRPGAPSRTNADDLVERIGSSLIIETVEAPRAIALLNRHDYRKLDAYIVHYRQPTHVAGRETMLERLGRALRRGWERPWSSGAGREAQRGTRTITQIFSATHWQRYEDGELAAEGRNRLERLPVVHVQNLAQPLMHEGLSDVEPLIPLQDELNTRLSDRANRVTMQSFRMWLGKGIEGFTERPVGPGQMWVTDNLDASIESFGGDADSPSERQHIDDLREAMDRASGVTPAAAGHIKARVGNLTSENALRISLMGTIAKVKRKRVTYGAGIEQLCELALHALDACGVFHTQPRERRVRVTWTDPLASDESRRIEDALRKAQLGVPLEVLRAELGYTDDTEVSAGAAAPGLVAAGRDD